MVPAGDIRIGISGWTYPPWRGGFYPKGLPQRAELAHAARVFRTIEINGTFYGLQRPATFARWAEATPDGFVFAVKAPRFITHDSGLVEPETPIANFLASGVLRLGDRLGPILWQFPPGFRFEPELFAAFLALLPQDGAAALALAERHDAHVGEHTWLAADGIGRIRHAVEIRHESFCTPDFVALLRRHRVALVAADAPRWPALFDLTTDFAYCRLHGGKLLYRSSYDGASLDRWAARLQAWSQGLPMTDGGFIAPGGDPAPMPRDVYLYFDNTMQQAAPVDALALVDRLQPAQATG
ncbi:DUF72 domain-containing protein [Geminicoccus harenae]|uniref:DUF72 domain-containing protein n=1 Tax=Geminicoccus harenae TaxID=2498453 RepID=UPI001C95746E|nr:DUF72 domain-containing protein [Geminicoccus harenae]